MTEILELPNESVIKYKEFPKEIDELKKLN